MEWLPAEFHFVRPQWLMLSLPIALVLLYFWRKGLSSQSWEGVCDKELLPHILIKQIQGGKKQNFWLISLACFLAILALAGPTWERLPQPVYKKDSALVILLDLSLSMNAGDIKPSRLERARFKISDLLKQREEGQTALMVYAGNAFTVTPLTDDIKTIQSQLSALSPDIMPVPGSNTSGALQNAVGLLTQAGVKQGHILLITDEVAGKHKDVFGYVAEQGYKVSILGVGTRTGAPIPVARGGFLKGPNGEIVLPKLNNAELKEMAVLGKGHYYNLTSNNNDIDKLSDFFTSNIEFDNESIRDMQADVWKEQGPWLLLLLLPLVSLSFRKGILVLVLLPNIIFIDSATALDWQSLWLNKQQQAKQFWDKQDYEKAAELFSDKTWKSAAEYKANDFSSAESLLSDSKGEHDLYNLGNALARQGKYKEAIAAYDKSLEINPDNKDAIHNKKIIEDELKKQQQSGQQGEQSSQNKDSSDSQGQSEQQQKKNQGSQQQEQNKKSEQHDVEQQNAEQQNSQQQQNNAEQKKTEMQQPEKPEDEENNEGKEEVMQALKQEQSSLNEDQQATEQWLRRIPDDPGGLLKRKFEYQYQRQSRHVPQDEQYW